MPAPPWAATRRVQLLYSPPALTSKIKSLASKTPLELLCLEHLVGKLNATISPGFRPKTESIELIARLPPVCGGFPDVSRTSERPDIDSQCLLYRAAPAKEPSAHNRNPLGIFW
jgi:hypothetical protein